MALGTGTRVFVGRLAGTPVYDPIGDRVGKVHDVVVVFRLRGNPSAVGLVVDVTGKRRVFMPLTRVTSIANGQVITTGLLNIRRFEKRPSETMVLGEVLDREVQFNDGSGKAVVEDVAIEQTGNREWRLTSLYVRMSRGGPEAGNTKIVPVASVSGLRTRVANQAATALLAQINELKAPDIADLLSDLPDDRIIAVSRHMHDDLLADVLEEMSDADRVTIMSALEVERAADILEEMEPDDAADLINELPPAQAEILLSKMEPDEAQDVRRLMSYGERTAGGLMTTEPMILSPDAHISMLLAAARREDLAPAIASTCFIVRPPTETPTGQYLGVVHLQRALREPPSEMVGSIIDQVEILSPDDGIGTITRLLATYNLTILPVVDNGLLVGAVSVDDVLDHLMPEDWRDADEDQIDTRIDERHVDDLLDESEPGTAGEAEIDGCERDGRESDRDVVNEWEKAEHREGRDA
ncbi:MAG: CBS domain-containing protein [Trueperella sp.]|uniref:magnesium transporter MgtE N-terminal domain-containing protein n=1 Tax=Trueperella TaxID=1069494 RepID=UPI0025F90526|nr:MULTISPECIES: CBS domain-containing protein [Trueperella]MCI7306614.1 CBS domain-containing protein [Trueperella sp.]MDY5403804.1 CBS domain-containing protein [Trueperella sp.]